MSIQPLEHRCEAGLCPICIGSSTQTDSALAIHTGLKDRENLRAQGRCRSADCDFDDVVHQRWFDHLAALPESVAETKRCKSGYWHNCYEALNVFDDPVVVNVSEDSSGYDILMAQDEDDCEKFNWIPEVETNEPDDDDPDCL